MAYEHEFVLYFDFFHATWFTEENMSKFLHAIGNEIVLDFWLTKSESEDDIKGMPRDKDDHSIVRIYVVASVQIYALHCILQTHKLMSHKHLKAVMYHPWKKTNGKLEIN